MKIPVPTSDGAMSSLDGLELTAIDTDIEQNLCLTLLSMHRGGLQVVGILPFLFFGIRSGYLIVTYDRTKDPRSSSMERTK
jgi:hypothetical protein